MTVETTQRAAASIPRPALWCIGRDHRDGVPADFAVSWADWHRDVDWAKGVLAQHGVQSGTAVLIVGGMPESPWFDPFETAVLRLGGHYSLGETHAFDAFRTGLYATRLEIEVVFGINSAVVEGLQDDVAAALGRVRTLLARPSAAPLLRAVGLTAAIVTRVGPALAVECPAREGAHVNGAEWSVTSVDGELYLSTVGPRASQLDHERVHISGTVRADPCPCGRDDPRVDVDPSRAL
jgi:hypothetical protein